MLTIKVSILAKFAATITLGIPLECHIWFEWVGCIPEVNRALKDSVSARPSQQENIHTIAEQHCDESLTLRTTPTQRSV